jgi:hypothetical protein
MSGRLLDYLAQGDIADIPLASDLAQDPAIIAGVGAIYFAVDEGKAYALDPAAPAWVPLVPAAPSARPAFSATKGGTAQTGIPSGTPTLITCDTEDYDIGGYYDAGASRWTPPAGVVTLTLTVAISGIDVAAQWGVILAKNGSNMRIVAPPSPDSYAAASITVMDSANGSDYYEMLAYGITSGTLTVNGAASYTYFQGAVIG